MDKVFIEALEIECVIGIYDWERRIRQPIVLDIEMGFDNRRPAASDAIGDTIDYGDVASMCGEIAQSGEWQLIESLVEAIACAILAKFPVSDVRLVCRKPGAVPRARCAGVSIHRSRVDD